MESFILPQQFFMVGSALLIVILAALLINKRQRKQEPTGGLNHAKDQQTAHSMHQYQSLFAYNPDIVLQLDRSGQIVEANIASKAITGWAGNTLLQKKIYDLLPKGEHQLAQQHLEAAFQGEVRTYETEMTGEGERIISVQVSIVPIRHEDEITGSYWIAANITERKAAEQLIQYMAYHDDLTGVPNLRMLHKRLNEALVEARQNREKLAILYIDLDRFKVINDRFGHSLGDRVIKIISERLHGCLNEGEMIARLGGDEFAILFPGITDHTQISVISKKIIEQFAQKIVIEQMEFHLSPTMGIAVYPDHGEDAEALTKHAEKAMYHAKKVGNDRIQVYRSELECEGPRQYELEIALRKALEQHELTNFYQPKVDIVTNRIVGMEALVRWLKPDGTMIPPSEFIPLAEETGLIIPLGKQVLREACLHNKKWLDEGKEPLCVSVNISYVQFGQPDFLDTIREVLQETGLPPCYLELEITEGIAMNDIPRALEILQELQRIGIKISIDDFGTGYSSLSYLSQFPIQALKIDKSFIQGTDSNPNNKAIILAILAMAKSLGINIIAEGVEKAKQLYFLRKHGCHVVQGFYFSPPIPADKFEEYVASF